VTVRYVDGKPTTIETIVLSTQHDPGVNQRQIHEAVVEEIIKPVIPAHLLRDHVNFLINPTGRFVLGGPMADAGVTGRKIIVDTYGGAVPHGGGAFSGKDPSKVDRSAAYATRYVAKNIVAAGLAENALYKSLMPLALLNRLVSWWKRLARAKYPMSALLPSCVSILICVPKELFTCLTCCGPSIIKPQLMVTLVERNLNSPGKLLIALNFYALKSAFNTRR